MWSAGERTNERTNELITRLSFLDGAFVYHSNEHESISAAASGSRRAAAKRKDADTASGGNERHMSACTRGGEGRKQGAQLMRWRRAHRSPCVYRKTTRCLSKPWTLTPCTPNRHQWLASANCSATCETMRRRKTYGRNHQSFSARDYIRGT
jgi:hypothetical protein